MEYTQVSAPRWSRRPAPYGHVDSIRMATTHGARYGQMTDHIALYEATNMLGFARGSVRLREFWRPRKWNTGSQTIHFHLFYYFHFFRERLHWRDWAGRLSQRVRGERQLRRRRPGSNQLYIHRYFIATTKICCSQIYVFVRLCLTKCWPSWRNASWKLTTTTKTGRSTSARW